MNIKRKHLILIGVVAMIALAGCAGQEAQDSQEAAEDLGKDTGEDISNTTLGASYEYEIRMTEKNQDRLVRAQPPNIMDSSLERQNLINRYDYLNDENNVHHVYLMSNDGKVVSYFVAQGKVSSVNSKLTNDKQIVQIPQTKDWGSNHGEYFRTVESPQMDGSYGTNGDAIFFFTTSGDYVEWNGKYLVSEEPRNIQTAVSLEEPVDDDDSTNSTDG
jgi:hypothetical protein